MRLPRSTAIVCAALALFFVAAPAASASPSQIDFFEAPQQLLYPGLRAQTIPQLESLGVHALRIQLVWENVAPAEHSRSKPKVNLASPASYNWGQYLPLIQEAQSLHWPVLLTVTGAAPCWASACARINPHHESAREKADAIVTDPNPVYYGKLLHAVGVEFGAYVKLYSIWNEPNQPQMLLPQYVHGTVASAAIYRQLWLKGYAGLKASGNFAGMKVLFGETSPYGDEPVDIPAPLIFMRAALCLNASYQRLSSCGRIPAAGYAQHPYDQKQGPYWIPPSYDGGADDVTMASLGNLSSALDKAAAAGALPAHLPIYITEYGVQSKPNTLLGVPLPQQAEYDAIAEQMAYDNPRVASFDQYLLTDDPDPGEGSFQTGLETVQGNPKPLYYGYRLPLTVTVQNASKVAFWGLVRAAGGAGSTVTLEYSDNNGKTWAKLLSAQTDARGYWSATGDFAAGRVWRVQWTASDGTVYDGAAIRAYKPGSRKPAS